MKLTGFTKKRDDEKKSKRAQELQRKWGSECDKSNEECERTHQYIIESTRPTLESFKGPMGDHLRKKHEFEKRWQDGEFTTWRDFYLGGHEIYERERDRQLAEDRAHEDKWKVAGSPPKSTVI